MDRFGGAIVGGILFAVLAVILIYHPFSDNSVPHSYATIEAVSTGAQNRWNTRRTTSPAVLYDYESKMYQMWYVGLGDKNASGIGFATSTDGVHWKPQVDQIITTNASWEAHGFRSVDVVQESGRYYAWYSAEGDDGVIRIGFATSPDGLHWAKSASNPVVTPGDSGAWDSKAVGQPAVVRVNGEWHMWYTGTSANGVSAIGYAASPDGIHWSKGGSNPVVSGRTTWDAGGVGGASVSRQSNGQLYQMWFAGVPKGKNQVSSLGRAYSTDGQAWVEDTGNPLVIADSTGFVDPWVVTVDGVAQIWTEVAVTKPLARQTIHFTQWSQMIANGSSKPASVAPPFADPSVY